MEPAPLDAGEFGQWAAGLTAAIAGTRASDVPCGECTACCSSSQFVHIAPDERDALAHIPTELLFPAPRMPRGHVLMGYDEQGRCPMLVDNRCSIYAHRPRTCRTYDCRVFEAASVTVEEPDKVRIRSQAVRWRFTHATAADHERHRAVQAAAAYLLAHRSELPDGAAPVTSTQRAVLAFGLHHLFLADEPTLGAVVDALSTLRS